MIRLTEAQRQELSAPEPLAVDPQTQQTYVLVHRAAEPQPKTSEVSKTSEVCAASDESGESLCREAYDRLKALL